MTSTKVLNHQKAIRQWIDIDHFHAPFAVTLTLKRRVMSYHGRIAVELWLTQERASQNFRQFINLLNKKIYGNATKRSGKRVQVFAVLEGGDDVGKHLHYHAVIDCPRDELIAYFPDLIAETWWATQWGDYEIDVVPADQGWITYMTKLRDKADYADSFDWTNCNYH